jgi:MoaA/NifB/PqqE/SkfB family radical SAM enzyme
MPLLRLAGVKALDHPLGLRALPELGALGLADVEGLAVAVTVQHVLECRAIVEQWLAEGSGPRLVLALRGPVSFAAGELARVAPGLHVEQVEAAVTLLQDWARRFAPRLEADLATALVGLSPDSTLADLRMHLDGLRRHRIVVDPLTSATDPCEPRDDRVAALVAAVSEFPGAAERQGRLATLLDEATAKARGPSRRHLRLLPSLRERGLQPPTTTQVECTWEGDLRPDRVRAADAIVAMRSAARSGARTVVLTGREPADEWYLADLVELARSLGLKEVVLTTSATSAAEPGRAGALAQAGVTRARVTVGPLDVAPRAQVEGIRALLAAGIGVELVVDVAAGREGDLAAVAAQVPVTFAASPASPARVERVFARVADELPVAGATRALAAGVRAARLASVTLEVEPGTELPPCAFDDPAEVGEVLRLSEGLVARSEEDGAYGRIAACTGCGARHACPGPLRSRRGEIEVIARPLAAEGPAVPITAERRQVLHEYRSLILRANPDGSVQERRVLRVNFHCNQACDFCFVSRQLPAPEEALIEAELREAAEHDAELAISGGEPTINPRLLHYVARARELGIEHLELQTNAIKMSDRPYAAALAAAGLPVAFVSLHGTTAATSDRVTSAPGTFEKTVEGMRNLLREGVMVRANFVVCGYNFREFPLLPGFVDRELRHAVPGARVEINFSFVAPSSNVPRDAALVPRFSDVAWALEAALERSEALGITMVGFDSQCGVPPCFLPERVRDTAFAEDLPPDEVRAFEGSFRKGEGCAGCSFTRRCYGVRAGYAEMYGTSELRALS